MFSNNEIKRFIKCMQSKNFDNDIIKINYRNIYNTPQMNKIDDKESKYYYLSKPFLKEGYIYEECYKLYAYFRNKDGAIDIFIYSLDFFDFIYSYSTFKFKDDMEITIGCLDKDKYSKYNEESIESYTNIINSTVLIILSYMNMIVHDQVIKIEEITKTKRVTINSNSKKKKKNKNIKTIELTSENIIKRIFYEENDGEKKKYNRHINSWTTRGHYRTYKSGKRIWIESHSNTAKNPINNIKVNHIYNIK